MDMSHGNAYDLLSALSAWCIDDSDTFHFYISNHMYLPLQTHDTYGFLVAMRCSVGSIRRYGTGACIVQVLCTAFLDSRTHYKSDCTYDIDLLDYLNFPDS